MGYIDKMGDVFDENISYGIANPYRIFEIVHSVGERILSKQHVQATDEIHALASWVIGNPSPFKTGEKISIEIVDGIIL